MTEGGQGSSVPALANSSGSDRQISISKILDSETDLIFREWLLASFPLASDSAIGNAVYLSPDTSNLETMLTSHALFRRLLQAVLTCQTAAQVDVPERALTMAHEGQARDQAFEVCEHLDNFGSASQDLSKFLTNYCGALEDIASQLTNAHETINQICDQQQKKFLNLTNAVNIEKTALHAKLSEPALRTRFRSAIRELKTELVNKRKRGRLPAESTALLTTWWSEHERWPYPTETEKNLLCASTGLNAVQLNNWFINRRKRQWSKSPEGV